LLANPQLTGAAWDAAFFYYESLEQARTGGDAIERAPEVAATARGVWLDTAVNGRFVYALAQEAETPLRPAITSGHLPEQADEIVMGETTLAALDLEVGETAVMAFQSPSGVLNEAPQTVRVVGTVVLSSPIFANVSPGEGAFISLDLARRWSPNIYEWAGFLVRFQPGISNEEGLDAVSAKALPDQGFTNQNRSDITALHDLQRLPWILAGVLVALIALTFLHSLLVTTHAQLQQIATLRSLGLTGRQVLGAGAVQGAAIVALALVIAAPIGALLARLSWERLADYLLVVPHSRVDAGPLALLACGLTLAGSLAGAIVMARGHRMPPGVVLRTPEVTGLRPHE
jgi:hypothetical protein